MVDFTGRVISDVWMPESAVLPKRRSCQIGNGRFLDWEALLSGLPKAGVNARQVRGCPCVQPAGPQALSLLPCLAFSLSDKALVSKLSSSLVESLLQKT